MTGRDVAALLASHPYRAGAAWLEAQRDDLVRDVIRVCEIPAPPFGERERAEFVAARLRASGFEDVHLDGVGNVVCPYRSPPPGRPALVVTAHLDTVFPPGIDVRVRRRAGRLYAPGIGDNAASVALLMHLPSALRAAGFRPDHGLAFVANVGEEGLGDLRGMRYLFDQGLAARWPVGAVLVLDGPLGLVSHRGIASRRLEVVYTGPGGHSWSDFGRPSALHALGRAIAALDALPLPEHPRTTLNVGVAEGGTSVNAIAARARMVVDLRSEDPAALAELERRVRAAVDRAARTAGGPGGLACTVRVVGDRPGGGIPEEHPLVQRVLAVTRAFGLRPRCTASSTDANVPLSRGVPALAVGTKEGGGAHTLDEYVEEASLLPGARYALAVLLAVSGWLADRPSATAG